MAEPRGGRSRSTGYDPSSWRTCTSGTTCRYASARVLRGSPPGTRRRNRRRSPVAKAQAAEGA
eukprot:1204710-Rhodomonas_salina.4